MTSSPAAEADHSNRTYILWACIVALTATSFTFILRMLNLDEIGAEFGLDATQVGVIKGAGLWPFAISIVGFSLLIDRVGYFKAIIFAFICHLAFAVMTIFATGFWTLYIGSLLGGLAAGAIEAAINPVVATLYPKEKTKYLNILHAGWPAGLVLAGILNIIAAGDGGPGWSWQARIGIVGLPVVAYGLMLLRCRFPVNERVATGVSYEAMLKEVGFFGAAIALFMILSEVLVNVAGLSTAYVWVATLLLAGAYGAYTKALGRPLFILLTLTMVPLAITELGVDSWVSDLMGPEMEELGLQGAWVLIYTSAIMLVLRFCAGPIVAALTPLGLLAVSSALAIAGLVYLSTASGMAILIAATLYGMGKTFFWPTMLGVVSEQFPKGGALTLNLISGVGMLAAGVIGAQLLGNIQDRTIDQNLMKNQPAIHKQVVGEEKGSVFGSYRSIDAVKTAALPAEQQAEVKSIQDGAKKDALSTAAIFPCIMLLSYLGMILYFRSKGGYTQVHLEGEGHAGP